MSGPAQSPDNRLTVDLAAIVHNLGALRALLPRGARVAGVVKADAYGHGLVPVARALKDAGAEALAVAVLAEGAHLRKAGVQGPIYLLLGVRPDQARRAAAGELTPICADLEVFRALDAVGRERGRPVPCQLKVDTGMGRLGLALEETWEALEQLMRLPGIELTGLVSHLATAGDPSSDYAPRQATAFAGLLAQARQRGLALADSSLAGSGGVLAPVKQMPSPPCLVRLGVALYGGLPDPASAGRAELKGAMSFTSRLLTVRRAPAGTLVSYGCTWRARRDTWLGVVPAGYSDGYPRSASNRARMLVAGRPAPIRGRVCMNLTVIDLEGFDPLPRPGEAVTLLGRQGGAEITADQLAAWAGTIPYEITCSLGAANKRRYS